jgi:hypothetical protein
MEGFFAFRVNHFGSYWRCAMNKWNPEPSPTPDWDAEEVGAALDAQSLPPGSERTEALKKADQLRNAADVYRYVFSTELRPPE